jgi:hypothetical protein
MFTKSSSKRFVNGFVVKNVLDKRACAACYGGLDLYTPQPSKGRIARSSGIWRSLSKDNVIFKCNARFRDAVEEMDLVESHITPYCWIERFSSPLRGVFSG